MEAQGDETISIPVEEYEALFRDADFLAALEQVGVDNWDGYSDARRLLGGNDEI